MITLIHGQDAHAMTLQLLEATNAAALIPAGGSVALKPNLVLASAPENGATTHAGVLSGCAEYFLEYGVKEISVIEGSWVGADTMRSMRAAGYDAVCKRYAMPFFDLKMDQTRPVQTAVGTIDICRRALDAGLLVNLPVLKGHCQTIMTCALKNLKGCIPDNEKRRFHQMELHKPIAALAAALKPGLIVVDGICGDLDFEEGGTPVQSDRMFAGTDAVQIDAYGCALMGIGTAQVPYIALAEQFGAGQAQLCQDDIVLLNRPNEGAAMQKPSGAVARLTRSVREDQACSACFANLVRALHTARRGQNVEICIGQGWRGKLFSGLGVGACCKGASEYAKGCPPTVEAIASMLMRS